MSDFDVPLPGIHKPVRKMNELQIIEHGYLPPQTILVSSDIARSMREKFSEEGRDKAFLRAIGITEEPK